MDPEGAKAFHLRVPGHPFPFMAQPSKETILAAYRDLVGRTGRRVGCTVFEKETGISSFYWRGGHWPKWSELQAEAGFAPNQRTKRIDDEVILRGFVELAREIRRVPTRADLALKRRRDSTFPDKGRFARWGNNEALLQRAVEFCERHSDSADVLAILQHRASAAAESRLSSFAIKGFVYLIRSGKSFKLGRSNAAGRRLRELAVQLPEKPDTVHVIETDDPEGIEAYWHHRFADRRQGGEWFSLSKEDVAAFKRRRFQ